MVLRVLPLSWCSSPSTFSRMKPRWLLALRTRSFLKDKLLACRQILFDSRDAKVPAPGSRRRGGQGVGMLKLLAILVMSPWMVSSGKFCRSTLTAWGLISDVKTHEWCTPTGAPFQTTKAHAADSCRQIYEFYLHLPNSFLLAMRSVARSANYLSPCAQRTAAQRGCVWVEEKPHFSRALN